MQDKVLIVDDQENNRLVIEDILRKSEYDIRMAESGEEALKILEHWVPDLILMDQMMPGFSGIETTAKIKTKDVFAHIPIVMVTAKNEVDTLKEAFEAGAVDYIIKPVESIALTARTRSALRTKHAFAQIKTLTENLQAQKRELTNFTHRVSHDLKSPVASAASLFDFFLLRLEEEYPHILEDKGLEDLLHRIPNVLNKMLDFIDTMLNYASAGKIVGKLERVPMGTLVADILTHFEHQIQEGIMILEREENMPDILCDSLKIGQVWQNLVSNSIKHRGAQTPVTLKLGYNKANDYHQFWVQDNGPGIAPEYREKVFEPFLRLTNVEGSGIGLATVQQIVLAHHGKIQIDPDFKNGTRFVFWLPCE